MADELKAPALIDGKEVEVVLAKPPAGYIAEADANARLTTEVQRRVLSAAQTEKERLANDPSFISTILEKHGPKPKGDGTDGSTKPTGDDINKLKTTWNESELKPVVEKLTKAEQTVQQLRQAQLVSEIVTAAAGKLKKSMLTPAVDGAAPPIVALVKDAFAFDETSGTWAVKDGTGFQYSTKPTNGRPYKGPEEFVAEWAARKENSEFVQPQGQDGARFGTEGGPGGRNVILSKEDAHDNATFRRAEEQAAKMGGVVIVR